MYDVHKIVQNNNNIIIGNLVGSVKFAGVKVRQIVPLMVLRVWPPYFLLQQLLLLTCLWPGPDEGGGGGGGLLV